jgi:hypothetical protein
MAENDKSAENFALGVIVAVILYLILRREIGKLPMLTSGNRGGGLTRAEKANGGCGCGSSSSATPSNPGISPGAQSFDDMLSFPASVVSHGAQFTEVA